MYEEPLEILVIRLVLWRGTWHRVRLKQETASARIVFTYDILLWYRQGDEEAKAVTLNCAYMTLLLATCFGLCTKTSSGSEKKNTQRKNIQIQTIKIILFRIVEI
jgi:hypothetical protein